jgi:hypothetical protein
MPAINPSRLNRQVEAAMAQAADSGRFVRAVREIVEYYADRTKRSTAASEALIMSNVLRVPRPVLAAVCSAIQAHAEFIPAERHKAAAGLWDLAYRETRYVAVCLARGLEAAAIPGVLERWAAGCDDRQVLSWMAEEGLRDWWDAPGSHPWRTLRTWMAGEDFRVRNLSLLALLKRVEGGLNDADLPRVFRLLKGAVGNVRSDGHATLSDLIALLAKRSTRETARYLMDEIKRGSPGIKGLVRSSLGAFTPDLRRELEAAL